jgi:hypothetical protein
MTPTEQSPQYGLDHEFTTRDPEFLPTMAGATGETPIAGNAITILNNGDEFYPAMLEGSARAAIDHHRGRLLGRDWKRGGRSVGGRSQSDPGQILLDAVGWQTSAATKS